MTLVCLTCPHCGYQKKLEEFFLPLEGTETTCENCHKIYIFMDTQVQAALSERSIATIPPDAGFDFSAEKSQPTFEFNHTSPSPLNANTVENMPRKPWIAGLLCLLQPGLGQIYNGEIRKALLIYLIPILFIPGIILCLYSSFIRIFLVTFVLFVLAYYVLVFVDAIRVARRFTNLYSPKKYNKAIVYIGTFLMAAILSNSLSTAIKSNFIQAYKIPSAAMEPTLLIGDHILVDRSQSAKKPHRGDLIVFEFPEDPTKDFIKRVVAVEGDTVWMRNKELFVRGKAVTEAYVVHNEADTIPASQNPRDNFKPQVIPANSYFVMGDNRDRSYDSRFWGAVPGDKIKGTVKSIYWSWDRVKASVRWERIGMKVPEGSQRYSE